MLEDIHEKRVAAIDVALDAILVSTKDGKRYFVANRFATFSQLLLLNPAKGEAAPDYQLVWLPNASVGAQSVSRSRRCSAPCVIRRACWCRC